MVKDWKRWIVGGRETNCGLENKVRSGYIGWAMYYIILPFIVP